ncbi:hypothetical protein PPN31114_02468 [Pandoraea pneumonica]|jgi:uncharacterized protein YecE (DUF72 family)|uniref:DUF72 domain-containing protein n=1 Tax=Pandoraea pneumonica TaxID=2508299 RepID=A0A5E4V5P0_9BURK|nr:DUF72 domain-containing protein [Pandoraea pneumonica]VVE07622.1 hypothetical protein PPN31114_02468 [Pandoraea pneumonica]
MTLRVGTSSWTDRTLIACGRFYPPGVDTPEARLRHYASQFDLVEVDSSYYRLPDAGMAWRWTQRTPPSFRFHIKAFRAFTGHTTPASALPRDIAAALNMAPGEPVSQDELSMLVDPTPDALVDPHVDLHVGLPTELRDELWRRYLEAIEPLRQSGQLAAIHFQFSPRVQNDRAGRALVFDTARRLDGERHAIEFRHRSWFDTPSREAATLAMLRETGAAHTIVDSPTGFDNTVPAVWATTRDDLCVVRLHGRNAAAWNRRGIKASSGRFVYEYSASELIDISARVARIAAKADDTHVLFNTNHEDQGMRNAAAFQRTIAALARGDITVNTTDAQDVWDVLDQGDMSAWR